MFSHPRDSIVNRKRCSRWTWILVSRTTRDKTKKEEGEKKQGVMGRFNGERSAFCNITAGATPQLQRITRHPNLEKDDQVFRPVHRGVVLKNSIRIPQKRVEPNEDWIKKASLFMSFAARQLFQTMLDILQMMY